MNPLLRRLAAFAAIALLAGACSLQRVAYNNASPALAWYLDDYVDLNDGQRDWLRERVGRLIAWHRASELPAYQRFVQETVLRTAERIDEEDARWVYRGLRTYYYRLLERVLPESADFLLQLDAAQLAQLERTFAQNQAKAIKDSVTGSPAERREKRVKRFVDQVEGWTGRLSAPQRELVGARVRAMSDTTDDWLADRRYRQLETLALARAKPPREELIAGLKRLYVEPGTWRRPDYVERMREREEQVFSMVAALDATLTPAQRQKLAQRLRGYAADIAYLMAAS